jgi:hypothetical protein
MIGNGIKVNLRTRTRPFVEQRDFADLFRTHSIRASSASKARYVLYTAVIYSIYS